MKTLTLSLSLLLSAIAFGQNQQNTAVFTSKARKSPATVSTMATPKKTNPLYQRSITRNTPPAIDNEATASKNTAVTTAAPVAEIKAFPNPFTSQIDVIITDGAMEKSVYTASLFDLNGRKVFQEVLRDNQSSLPLSQLSTGVYFLHIEKNGTLIKHEKFVKE